MALTHYRFIHPSALAAIRDLPLVARTVVDGFMYGAHPSHMPGAGLIARRCSCTSARERSSRLKSMIQLST